MFQEGRAHIMNYSETIEYIHSIPKFSRILGNDLLRRLLEKMGNPQRELKYIHVGGTNGKGSICTMTAEVLTQAGYKTGLFTSPYLVRFGERIRINGTPIADDALAEVASYVREISEKYNAAVSEFAFDAAVAFEYFRREKCDFVVLEVGLGGKLDATNVIDTPYVTAFGAIGLDHCQYLGNTVDEISKDKFGIIKSGTKVVMSPVQEDIVFANAKEACAAHDAELIIPNINEMSEKRGSTFKYKGSEYSLKMLGDFQIYNAVTAIEIINALKGKGVIISDTALKSGLSRAKIDGRFEYLSDKLLIDGAHNPPAIKALLSALRDTKKHIYFLTAVMQDKDYTEISRLISDFAKENNSQIVTCEVDMPRCLSADKLSREYEKHGINAKEIKDNAEALKYLKNKISGDDNALICVCGTLYLAGEVKRGEN